MSESIKEPNKPMIELVGRHISVAAREFVEDPRTVGLSIGITLDGVVVTRHFGEVLRGSGRSPTDATLFEIGSITKTFVGLMLAQAELEGKDQLIDDVRLHLGIAIRIWHIKDSRSCSGI